MLHGLGLRVGEAARLRLQDIDWDCCVLTIHQTKFAKSRLCPIRTKTGGKGLKITCNYGKLTSGVWILSSHCFGSVETKAVRSTHRTVSRAFREVWPKLGLSVPPGVAVPRLHCLRHSFAVGTLLRWYRQGVEPMDRLLQLSTFMGHAQPSSTAVYLTITADLLKEANQRFERFASPLLKEVML